MTPDDFFHRLARTGRGFLMLDYDGTLAPFNGDRMRAFPAEGLLELLLQIEATGTTRIVLVTGRPVREIPLLMRLAGPMEVWGCHGREHLDPAGIITRYGVTAADDELLAEGRRIAIALAGEERVESKTGCCAIHWRPLTQEQREALRDRALEAWKPLQQAHGLHIDTFDGGIELSIPGRNKGDSVAALLDGLQPDEEDTCIAFLGDDLTDENGFRVLKGRGLCVLVKNHDRPTFADVRITLPDGVREFLQQWLRAVTEQE